MRGELVTCGGCENVTEVPNRPPVAPIAQAAPQWQPPTPPGDQIPAGLESSWYIKRVRSETNYPTLRGALTFVQVVLTVGVGFVAFGVSGGMTAGIAMQRAQGDRLGFVELLPLLFAILPAGVAAAVTWTVSKAVAQLFVAVADIADMMADQGRRRR